MSPANGVHDPVHRWEQRGGSCSVQCADGGEGGLAREGPGAACWVVQGGGVRRVRLCHRARYHAPIGCPLRLAAGSGMLRRVPLRQGIVLEALQCASSGGGEGTNMCDKCATDVGSLRCAWIHRRRAPAGPA